MLLSVSLDGQKDERRCINKNLPEANVFFSLRHDDEDIKELLDCGMAGRTQKGSKTPGFFFSTNL